MNQDDARSSFSSDLQRSQKGSARGDLAPSEQVGDYLLYKKLGSGGFGEVWLATHQMTASEVALKVLHPRYWNLQSEDTPTITDRFLTEGQMLMSIDHPGVVKVLDVVDLRPEGPVAYAMEVLQGLDMADLMDLIELPLLLEVMAQVAEHLDDIHREGIVHRDVKLSNIFLCDPNGDDASVRHVKLIDFGTAKDLRDPFAAKTATGHYVGTLPSIAPESFDRIIDGEGDLTFAVDQWGFGVALFQALTGDIPFEADGTVSFVMEVKTSPSPSVDLRPRFANAYLSDLERIVHRCLAKKPKDRYPTMRLLAEDLRTVRRKIQGQYDSDHFKLMLRKLPTSEGTLKVGKIPRTSSGRRTWPQQDMVTRKDSVVFPPESATPETFGNTDTAIQSPAVEPESPPRAADSFRDDADTLIKVARPLSVRTTPKVEATEDPFVEKTKPLPPDRLPSAASQDAQLSEVAPLVGAATLTDGDNEDDSIATPVDPRLIKRAPVAGDASGKKTVKLHDLSASAAPPSNTYRVTRESSETSSVRERVEVSQSVSQSVSQPDMAKPPPQPKKTVLTPSLVVLLMLILAVAVVVSFFIGRLTT